MLSLDFEDIEGTISIEGWRQMEDTFRKLRVSGGDKM